MSDSVKDFLEELEDKTINKPFKEIETEEDGKDTSDFDEDDIREIKINPSNKGCFKFSVEVTKTKFNDFKNGVILLSKTDKSSLFTDNQIKDDIIKYMLGEKKHIDTQIIIDETNEEFSFELFKQGELKERFLTEAIKEYIRGEEAPEDIICLKKDLISSLGNPSSLQISSVCIFSKNNLGASTIQICCTSNGELSIDIETKVVINSNGLFFTGDMILDVNQKKINESSARIINIAPATDIFYYWYADDVRDMNFFKGNFFNKDKEKSEELFSAIKEILSNIKIHKSENNIIQSIIDSDIFDFKKDLTTSNRIGRISYVLRHVFKNPMFKDDENNTALWKYYFMGKEDINYVKKIFSKNIEKHKRNLLSHVNNNEFFGLENVSTSSEGISKIIDDPKLRKYLSKNAINVIKTRSNDSHNDKGEQYVKNIFSIPFGIESQIDIDVKDIERRLDENVYGMEAVKRKILNHLAVMARSANATPPVICLSGPPGIGKTTICQILADSINRKFDMISCSGMGEAFTLIGTSYGYGNPELGSIIKSFIKCETMNPLILLDEIDKTGTSRYAGSVQDALVAILDPGQNFRFEDKYVGFPVDLSKVQFITTVNDLNVLSEPLRDRMVVIEMNGYDDKEKMEIMKKFSIPKTMKNYNIKEDEVEITQEAMNQVISEYGGDAGMRTIEATIKEILARSVYLLESGKEKIVVKNIFDFIDKNDKKSIGFQAS